ncbi:MAG: V-type ATP synthase subunit I [Oscillospiraceae bacterium]|nr:V-type ATP synthase subunit I [Oscillospiraceae bacterium]
MIVKMKKLRVIAMASERRRLMDGMLRLGCVEVSEPTDKLADPAWSALLRREESAQTQRRIELSEVYTALDAIARYGKTKEKGLHLRPEVTEETFLDDAAARKAGAASREINDTLQFLEQLRTDENRMVSLRGSLLPWEALDVPLEHHGTAHTVTRLEVCPAAVDLNAVRAELDAADAAAELWEISADKQQRYVYLLCLRSEEGQVQEILRAHGFSVTVFTVPQGTAKENLVREDELIARNHAQQRDTVETLSHCDGSRDMLRLYADRLETETLREETVEAMLTDGTILFFEGWAPAERMGEVGALLDGCACAWEASDPTEDEIPDVPVALKNNRFTRPLNMVTDMYSLPSYAGVDPNPLMSVFFILFYGIMMADMGYGLVMMALSLFVIKKSKPNGPTMRNMMPLMFYCGVSTFLMGALTGGFFGDFIPQLLKLINPESTFRMPALFSPLDDAVTALIGSLVLGLVHIFFGMGVSVSMKLRRGQVMDALCNEIVWYAVFALGAAGIVTGQQWFLWAIVLLLVATQGYGKKGLVGKLMGIFGSLYNNVTGYFSDILSYSRLMALMLAGAVIAQVFNTIGAITGNVVGFFVISLLGNTLNFALNLLGCYVHDMRLQCLEFFGRFYEDGGKPFRPLQVRAKYVDVIEN